MAEFEKMAEFETAKEAEQSTDSKSNEQSSNGEQASSGQQASLTNQAPFRIEPPTPREGRPQECPKCGKVMSYLSGQGKIPWPEVFTGPECPDWYRPWYSGAIYSHSNPKPQCRSP